MENSFPLDVKYIIVDLYKGKSVIIIIWDTTNINFHIGLICVYLSISIDRPRAGAGCRRWLAHVPTQSARVRVIRTRSVLAVGTVPIVKHGRVGGGLESRHLSYTYTLLIPII